MPTSEPRPIDQEPSRYHFAHPEEHVPACMVADTWVDDESGGPCASVREPHKVTCKECKHLIQSPFGEVPSALAIAHHFLDGPRTHGADGIPLWREEGEYCYLWKSAEIDHDLRVSYLLEIRTNRDGQETRDFLFVHHGVGLDAPYVQWRNEPINFHSTYEAHRESHYKGMLWFISRDEDAMDEMDKQRG